MRNRDQGRLRKIRSSTQRLLHEYSEMGRRKPGTPVPGRTTALVAFVAMLSASCGTGLFEGGTFDEQTEKRLNDTTVPTVTISSPVDGDPYGPTVSVGGTASDKASAGATGAVESIWYEVVGASLSDSVELDADGAYSFAFSTGGLAGSLTVRVTATDWNGNDSTAEVTLRVPGSVSIDSSGSHDFGESSDSMESPAFDVALSNTGAGYLTVEDITLDDATNFRLHDSAAATLDPGQSTSFAVSFRPSAPGGYSARVTVQTDDPVNPEVTVSLSGTGVEFALYETITDFTRKLRAVVYSGDGEHLVTGDKGSSVRLWSNDGSGWSSTEIGRQSGEVYDLAINHDNTRVASAGPYNVDAGEIHIWAFDGDSWHEETILRKHNGNVTSVDFAPGGTRIVSGSGNFDETVRIWEFADETWTNPHTLTDHTGIVHSVDFGPDGSRIVSGDYEGVVIVWKWDGSAWTKEQELRGHTEQAWSVEFSPDGETIATASADSTLRIWDFDGTDWSNTQILTESAHELRSISFNNDGTWLAAGGWGNDVLVWEWNGSQWQHRQTLSEHSDNVHSVAFGPSGEHIASAGDDKQLYIWK